MGKKWTSIHLGSLLISFESIIVFSKEISSLLSLIASIGCNDLVSILLVIVVLLESKFSAKFEKAK